MKEETAQAIYRLATAITPPGALGSNDATGCYVESLTEAIMGNTSAMMRLAESIDELTETLRHHEKAATNNPET
jgi:hypothetical protein